MTRRRRQIPGALVALAVLLGCGADPVRVQVRAFEHPEDVAFACFAADGSVRPLRECESSDTDPSVSLHALVTQGGRGQVGLVDLDAAEVLDADDRVPGFTFVPVGEIPSDIVVPEQNPELTYVSDLGSLDVIAIRTSRLRFGGGAGETFVRIPLPAAPTDLALSPDESKLYVALPSMGALAVIDRTAVAIGAAPPTPTILTLSSLVPGPVPALPDDTDYCRVCVATELETPDPTVENPVGCEGLLVDPWPTDDTGARVPTTPRAPAPESLAAAPRPVSMVVDALNGRLLVADSAVPVIHVIDVGTGAPLAPITTSVPVEGLAITPRVPATVDGVVDPADPTTYERYLYAIDATDRSVMAIRYDEAVPSESAVLPVSVRGGDAADRIRLPTGARVIEVVTPEYPDSAADPDPVRCTRGSDLEDEVGPLTMRGVFLVVGLLNGNLHVVDVYDLDAECRGGAPGTIEVGGETQELLGCRFPADPDDAVVYIRRHRPRIGSRIRTGLTLVSAPTASTALQSVTLEPDGSSNRDNVPGLLPLGEPDDMEDTPATCGPLEAQVFPFEAGTEALICALDDPWAAEAETWLSTWEGAIPGTTGGRGRFGDVAAGEFLLEIPPCARGVLGRDNLDALDPALYESLYQPDLLAVTGELPPSTEDREECRRFVDEDDAGGGLIDIEIPILRSEERLVDGVTEPVLWLADGPRDGRATLAELASCFPELVSYEIRSQGAYTVLGGRTGFSHRVARDAVTGLCTVDTSRPATHVGRALPGRVFDNGIVRFQIEALDPALGPDSEAEIVFQLAQAPAELSIPIADDLPTVVSDVVYSEMDERLYAVDTQFRGLVRMQLDPVRVLQAFE